MGSTTGYAANWICSGTDYWSNTTCWASGMPPVAGDSVIFQQSSASDRTINYDNISNPTAVFGEVRIDGTGGGAVTFNHDSNLDFNTDSLFLGRDGLGTLNQSNGRVAVGAGTIGARTGSLGVYNASGLASSQWGTLHIGYIGTGQFNQSGGSVMVNSVLSIGGENGGVGSYSLTGGSLTVNGEVNVGRWGSGSFYQDGGTHTVNGVLYIARKAGPLGAPATGTYTLDSGTLNATSMEVGVIPRVASAGSNTFPDVHEASNGHFIQNGGTVNIAGGLLVSSSGGAVGRYELNDGSLVASQITNNDTFEYRGGAISGNVTNRDLFAVSGPGIRTIQGDLTNVGTSFFSQADYAETKHGLITLADGTQMSITQNLTLEDDGTLAIELGTLFYGTTSEWISVGATADLGGVLDLREAMGFNPAVGDSWTLLSATTLMGTFSDVWFPVVPNWVWSLTYTDQEVILSGSASAVPVPAALWLFGSGLFALIGVARRRTL